MLRLDEQLLRAKQLSDTINNDLSDVEESSIVDGRLERDAKELNYLVKQAQFSVQVQREFVDLCYAMQHLGDAYGKALKAARIVGERFKYEG